MKSVFLGYFRTQNAILSDFCPVRDKSATF